MAKFLQNMFWIFLSLQLSECKLLIPEIPDECLNQTLCENVPNYPVADVNAAFKELNSTGYIWQNDVDTSLPKSSKKDKEYLDLCPSTPGTITPLAAKDINGKWRFVINNPTPGIQAIQVINYERCNDDVSYQSCGKNLAVSPPIDVEARTGYIAECRQEYLQRKLACLDEYGKVIETYVDSITCCSCAVFKKDF